MIGENVTEQPQEDLDQARARFWSNYLNLGGQSEEWFDVHVEALLKVAIRPPVQRHPQPSLTRSSFLPWGPEQFLEYYADERPAAVALAG